MGTKTVSHVSQSSPVKESRLALHVTRELRKQENAILSRHQIWKWIGLLLTLLIGVAALAPNAFEIPVGVQPWVFLIFICWLFAFCVGKFDQ
jgi:hypothetical protein